MAGGGPPAGGGGGPAARKASPQIASEFGVAPLPRLSAVPPPPLRGGGPAASAYLIACGLIGDPVPPVMTSGGPQKKNS
jgi:hypothetical protein